ncbi:MAG: CvpA family protein [Bacteroidetes bacterium]|nr:MAG: CvpA family protein [Bacteroidota bacterium]
MLDLFILAGLIGSIALGFKDGFFRKLYGVLGFLGGLCVALLFYSLVGSWYSSWFELPEDTARVLAFATIFLLFVLALNLFYRSIGTDKTKTISVWSRFAGGFVGAFQGALLISLLLLFANKIGLFDQQTISESFFYAYLLDFAPMVITYTMKWLPKAQEFITELQGKLKP